MTLETFAILIGAILGFFLLVGLILARLYKRATREVSLVKTGAGGKRVIMDGGAIVIPLLHEISPVNMKTLRLEVKRVGEAALITKDRMRVDVGSEFYVSVQGTEDGISRAAQTLGAKTFNVDQLREMIEGKLIDGLRAVAARMTMDELHENRTSFVQEVQNAVSNDLLKNGLELESVSLTALDQTPFDALDENNAFNAVGMRKLAEVIAKSKKERAAIDAEADVSVRRSVMEAEKLKLQIARDEEMERIARVQEIELLKAAQDSEIARSRETAESEKERARILREQEIKAAEIMRARAIEEAQITKEREIEVANQDRQVAIAMKSEEESRARASADTARAEAMKAAEAIETARTVAIAERTKQIALIEATQDAEREATRLRLSASAERAAAEDRAAARREEAQGEADAIMIQAEAKKADLLAEAEGRAALAQSENALSEDIVAMRVSLARLEAMPRIIAEMVKPAEKIDSIRINQISGLGAAASPMGGDGPKSPVNQAFDAMLGAALQLPTMKKLGEEIGLNFDGGIGGLMDDVAEKVETKRV
ncbi:MAG: flotillin domain-containing protein [Tabrizicola sp.]|uniref:flotillin family protein n=1 Tax=Tabrizicola sp. TaxID=2005166 RepID=UPI002ABCF2E5|nr:flotillin domain-containing protein [Tabrizicola sp.]MDZ4088805.1 flotillin domain-containing protein [Tabrizicola sp.]